MVLWVGVLEATASTVGNEQGAFPPPEALTCSCTVRRSWLSSGHCCQGWRCRLSFRHSPARRWLSCRCRSHSLRQMPVAPPQRLAIKGGGFPNNHPHPSPFARRSSRHARGFPAQHSRNQLLFPGPVVVVVVEQLLQSVLPLLICPLGPVDVVVVVVPLSLLGGFPLCPCSLVVVVVLPLGSANAGAETANASAVVTIRIVFISFLLTLLRTPHLWSVARPSSATPNDKIRHN